MQIFTESELESIEYIATERADALRGYTDQNRINGESHWRGIAEKADREASRMVRERSGTGQVEPATQVVEALTALVDVEGAIKPTGVVRELFLEARQALKAAGVDSREE